MTSGSHQLVKQRKLHMKLCAYGDTVLQVDEMPPKELIQVDLVRKCLVEVKQNRDEVRHLVFLSQLSIALDRL